LKRKHLLPAILTGTLMVGAVGLASAQQATTTATPSVTGLHEAEDEALVVQPFNLSVDKLDDMSIAGPAGEEIGEIDEVLVDASGKPTAVSAEVGGFLGIGDKNVVIGLDRLRLDGERLVTDLTKEQIEALPAYDD
jgi:hypothetical protein